MSTYVISDIHGCYGEFLEMLDKIGFSETDRLIIAGDIIDRGGQSFEMLKWAESCPPNVTLLLGNHEEKFMEYIELMHIIDRDEELCTDMFSAEDAKALYCSVIYFLSSHSLRLDFDLYGTIRSLIEQHNAALADLYRWAEIFGKLPYYEKINIGGRICAAVHGGYAETADNIGDRFNGIEEFYLYAREEGLRFGIPHGTVIFGHTPTVADGTFAYSGGKVFRFYNEENDCVFYDIDCGCAFRNINCGARLACIRLDDEKIFYV